MNKLNRWLHAIALFVGSVLLFSANAFANLTQFNDELLARFSFNEGSGSAATDSAGWNRHATINGDTSWLHRESYGNAMVFDGAGDYAILDASEVDTFNTDYYSYSVWIKPDVVNIDQVILSNHRSCGTCGVPGGFGLRIGTNGKLYADTWRDSNQTQYVVASAATLTAGVWTHVAVSFDGNDVRIYINGSLDTTATGIAGDTLHPSSQRMTLGALAFAAPTYFNFDGEIDELRIYGRGMTAAEVTALFDGAGGEPGGLFYESFDDQTSATTNNGYFGTGRNANFIAGGKYDGGLQIDDSNGVWVDITNKIDMDQGTISFLYRPDWTAPGSGSHTLLQTDTYCTGTTNAGVMRLSSGGTSLSYSFHGDGDLSNTANVTTTSMEPEGVGSFVTGEWHKVEVMWDAIAGYSIVAVDGVVANIDYDTRITTGGTAPTKLAMGRYASCAASWNFKGTIDELKILDDVNFDIDDPVAEYVRRARNDGKLQAHETKHNSPDWETVQVTGLGSSTFYQVDQFEFVGDGHVPDNGENTTEPFAYSVAARQTETLFFNYYSDVDQGDVTASIVGGEFSLGANKLSTIKVRAVKNWFQSAPSDTRTSQLIPSYTSELIVNDATVDLASNDWRAVIDDGNGNITADLPSFTLNDDKLAKVSIAADTSSQFAVNVLVPANAVAGVYTATLELKDSTNTVIDSLDLELTVLDIVLEEAEKELMITNRSVYDQFSCTQGQTGPDNESHCRNLVADGGNVTGKNRYLAQINDIAAHGFNGMWNFNDPASLTEANQIVSDLVFRGINKRIAFGDAFPDQAYGVYSTHAYDAMAGANGVGFLDSGPTFYTRDEPGFRNNLDGHLRNMEDHNAMGSGAGADSITSLFYDVELCIREGGVNGNGDGCETTAVLNNLGNIFPHGIVPTEPDCPGSECEPPDYPQLDLAVYNVDDVDSASSMQTFLNGLLNGGTSAGNHSLATQKEMYYWQTDREDPRFNRYYAGYFLFLTGLDGFMPFVYNMTIQGTDPYNDHDAIAGKSLGQSGFVREHMLAYPSSDGPIATVQWEALREGIDDYRHLQTWKTLHTAMAAIDQATADASEDVILGDTLLSIPGALAEFKGNIDGVTANTTISDFDTARAVVISEIVGLKNGIADNDSDGVANVIDNCIDDANPNQSDFDQDDVGNVCDLDDTLQTTLVSQANYDGYLAEQGSSGLGSNAYSPNAGKQAIRIGDGSGNNQLMGMLSFDTSSIPAGVRIDNALLELRNGFIHNDVSALGSLTLDLSNGGFGGNVALAASDFEAAATLIGVGTPVLTATNLWSGVLTSLALDELDDATIVQLRIRYTTKTNSNNKRDSLGFYPGDSSNANSRPKLIVTHSRPD